MTGDLRATLERLARPGAEPNAAFDPARLFATIEHELIEAARPRLVRIVDRLQLTDSLKIIKHTLQADGMDLSRTGPLYVYDRPRRTYVRITSPQELHTEHL